jgi:hypothetical protein
MKIGDSNVFIAVSQPSKQFKDGPMIMYYDYVTKPVGIVE